MSVALTGQPNDNVIRVSDGTSTRPHLQDSSLDCEIVGAVRFYRLTQTYLFLEDPPENIINRNLFVDPVNPQLIKHEPEKTQTEQEEFKQKKGKKKKIISKPNNSIAYLDL